MSTFAGSEHDLRSLAAILNQERADLTENGVPLSLLSDLKDQIPCDYVLFHGYDTKRNAHWFAQQVPGHDEELDSEPDDEFPTFWEHFWECKACSYPDHSGDLRSVVQETDFYSVREFHSTGMYSDVMKPQGFEHQIALFSAGATGTGCGSRTYRPALLSSWPWFRILRARPIASHVIAPAHARGLPRRRTKEEPCSGSDSPALGSAAPPRRGTHQYPDRTPTGPIGGYRPNAPRKHLWPAQGVEPHRSHCPRLSGPGCVAPAGRPLTSCVNRAQPGLVLS